MKEKAVNIAVRATRTYLQVLVAFLAAKGMGVDAGVLPGEFIPAFLMAAQIAVAPAVLSVLQNALEAMNDYHGTLKG